jgi:hypothetical protein
MKRKWGKKEKKEGGRKGKEKGTKEEERQEREERKEEEKEKGKGKRKGKGVRTPLPDCFAGNWRGALPAPLFTCGADWTCRSGRADFIAGC